MISIASYIYTKITKNILLNPFKTKFVQSTSKVHIKNTLKLYAEINDSTEESKEVPQADLKEESSEVAQTDLKFKNKDRSQIIPVETSIKYLKSAAFKKTYGNYLVWEQYRRNHRGLFPPRKTRKTCIRKGLISTGNPCPICRDEYLILDYRNLDLLRQFISPHTGQVLSYTKTGLCQKKHLQLVVAVERACDYGLLTFDVPFREFDYSEYYSTQ